MMSFKEFKASVSTSKVAGPQQQQQQPTTSKHLTDIAKESIIMSSPTPSTTSTTSSMQETTSMKMSKLFGFIDDTYRDIRRIHSGLHKDVYNTQLMQIINKYKNGCNKIFEDVLESHDMSKKLAQNIVRTIDIFKELCTSLTDLEEYQHRVCELMAIFIACELRLSVDSTIQDQLLIGQRIVFVMRRHLVDEVEEETRYNILKTLVYLPRLFNARDIMCAIFGQFIPMKPVSDVNVLPDKLYMLYIIVFYRWMMMQKDDDDKLLIVNFAESFMKPSVTLCTNQLYATHLPRYTTHSTATRTILNNMKFYRDIRNASIIDNALKKIGSIVDLCDDEEDADLIILDSATSTEFAEIFSAVQLETLGNSVSNIKLEEKTVVDTVDLTEEEEESANHPNAIRDRHDKWLNNFQQLAKQFRESQLIMERQQNSQLISSNQMETIICLDSDSENEDEELTAVDANANASKTQEIAKTTEKSSELTEDLFVDNYPPTVTPINCSTDLESSDVEDDDDTTKLSSRFLSGTIRTYQAKRMHQIESQANNETAYRRDSIHISSTPPDRLDDEYSDNQDDEGTDVQDEHDQEEDEAETFPPITLQKPRPRGPYPTYNNMQNNKVVFSQSITRLPYDKEQQNQETQQSEVKGPKKQKKKVHFNTNPVGPTVVQNKPLLKPALQQSKYKASDAPDYFHLRGFERLTTSAPSTAGSTSTCGSVSTTLSLNKQQEQQEHLAAAPTLFRNILGCSYSAPFSPSSSSASSRSVTSPAIPATPTKTRKKSRVPKTQKSSIKKRRPTVGALEDMKNNDGELNSEGEYSIIRSRESLKDVHNSSGRVERTSFNAKDDSRFRESSDDYYGATSDTDIIKNDAKLRNRCAVVIKPTKELLQYERRRDELYNEILQKQRRKLELRALEKQREKERRRLSRREENGDSDKLSEGTKNGLPTQTDKRNVIPRSPRNYSDICMSSESEIETNFQVRTRKQKQHPVKEIQPLASLLNEIDTYLDKPAKDVRDTEIEEPNQAVQDKNNDDHAVNGVNIGVNEKQQLCDIITDTGQTKMRELNLLADIAQHLSPYQLDLPECNKPPQSSSSSSPPPPPTQTPSPSPSPSPISPIERSINTLENSKETKDAEPKDKAIVTEQLIIQSFDNILEESQQIDKNEKLQPQQSQQNPKENLRQECQDLNDYAHEPKLNVAAIFNSSPASLLKDPNQQQNNTPVKDVDLNPSNNKINNTSLEQILEESIKSVTSPFNPNNECNASKTTQPQLQPQSESKIPLLISNVESLNHLQHNSLTGDITSKSDGDSGDVKNSKQSLNDRKSNQFNGENVFCMNKSTIETKDVTEEENTCDNTISRLINTVDSSTMCGDLSNMSSAMEMANNTQITTLIPADLSDISLESELSKHLPEIAEPSPVVTDMSDNSNESDVSKSFVINRTHPSTSVGTLESNDIPVMSLPDLPLVMPPIPPPPPLPQSQQTSISMSSSTTSQLEKDYNPLDTTLNTPIKQPSLPTGDICSAQSRGDLVTPLKFSLQPDLESDNSPLKSALEPENDSNVTKFLDLILNKTVTDAESEARDKIIKELNALTADTSATESIENIQKDDIEAGESKTLHSNASEDDTDADKNKNKVQNHVEEIKSSDSAKVKLSKDEKVSKNKSKNFSMKDNDDKPIPGDESVKNDTETSVERNEKQENGHKKDISVPESPEIFPPKVNSLKESATTSINTEPISTTTPNSEMPNAKLKISPVKQTFNIKCRVRLKRLNIPKHCKSNKKETWMAIPITKPEESETASNNPTTNCDNSKNDATTLLKKPCLKYNSNRVEDVLERKFSESFVEVTGPSATKKPKLEVVEQKQLEAIQTPTPTTQQETTNLLAVNTSNNGATFSNNVSLSTKSKSKNSKTVTFDLSNLSDEFKDTTCSHKQKSKAHTSSPTAGGLGYYHKNTKHPKKLPDNTLRAAETLQIFVNTINDCARTPPSAEFNRKRSPIKNKCIAEDETPRPPLASTLLETQSCKKVCPEKSRTQITSSKLKDQLVSSLATPSISNITSDITTARIYTSSPLDQTLPEYDVDNVDTVADSELILPTTTGSLRRKLKRPKKTLARPEPVDDTSTDDISNQPECNGDDDTDAVVDNEDDVFAEELLPIPAANEHILEEIVSGRPTHIGTGTVLRDDYMNIEATATVPVYLFNDESRDLATPEPIQSSDANVVDSSSYLNTPSTANATANASAATTSTIGNLEKSMLSPSEHEVSSTQETFYQTPTKSKQIDAFGDKPMANKDKSSGSLNVINNQMKTDDKTFQNKEDHPTSYSSGLLQNNQVDTTNHSPEMCSLTLGSTTTTTTTMTSNRKMRKASTHDEILFNELQQQQQQQQQVQLQQQHQQQHQQSQQKSLQQNKRKTTMFCAQSTSDNGNIVKNKLVTGSNLDDLKTNGSLGRIEDKFKKLLKEGANKRDKSDLCNDGSSGLCAANTVTVGGGGGSSPSTTTTIIEEKPSKSKRKKLKSSKSEKNKHNERSTKIVLKASKLAAHVPDNPLKITIPKSKLIRPPPTPPTPNEDLNDRDTNSFYNNITDKIAKDKDKSFVAHNHSKAKIETADSEGNCSDKARLLSGVIDSKNIVIDSEKGKVVLIANTSIAMNDKEKTTTNNTLSTKKKNKSTHNTDNLSPSLTITPTTNNNNSNSTSTTNTTNCLNKNNSNNNSNNAIFARDKYDLIKSKEKYNHHLQENKEKSKVKLNTEVKKHDNHNKTSSSSVINRHHNNNKTSAKEKNRKKDKEKHKSMDKTFTAQDNILRSITQKTTSSNLSTMTTLTVSPSSSVATSSDIKQNNNSSSKSSKTKLHDIANGSTSSATTQVLKSKTNLSTSQTSSLSSSAAAAGLTTQISTSSTASMSPSSVTISTNHVRKKLKTK